MTAPVQDVQWLDPLDRASMSARYVSALAVVLDCASQSSSPPSDEIVSTCLSLIEAEARRIGQALTEIADAKLAERFPNEVTS